MSAVLNLLKQQSEIYAVAGGWRSVGSDPTHFRAAGVGLYFLWKNIKGEF